MADAEVAAATAAAPAAPSAPSSPRASPRAAEAPKGPEPSRHRLRAEVAHVRAVEACGGGNVEFVASVPALERREAAGGHGERSARLREARRQGVLALRKAAEAPADGSAPDPAALRKASFRAAIERHGAFKVHNVEGASS